MFRHVHAPLVSRLLAVCVILATTSVSAAAFDLRPARQALQRLLPVHHAQIELVAGSGGARDRFIVRARRGHVVVEGNSPIALLVGSETYLEQVAGVGIGWPGDSLDRLPARLPLPVHELRGEANVPHRFALNDTDDGYADAYLDWPGWQHKIDLLALHGINEVFVPVGTEEVYRRTFREFGYSDQDIRRWIPTPAHQPWWLLQNMAGFNAPESPQLYARRAALGRKIAGRLRELGMTPVFPGYFGTVPPDIATRWPGTRTVPQGRWVDFDRPDWLDPRQPLFAKIGAAFYRHQRTLLGDSSMYKMDLLHEGGRAGDVPVGDAARAVMAALQTAHPGATWVLLGWQKNPPPALIDAVGPTHVLIVDGLADRYDTLDRERDWKGAPYAFGTIPNFGGHTTLGANTGVWVQRFETWRLRTGSALRGIAWMPEASGRDPAAFAFFTGLAWQSHPVAAGDWFVGHARYRYGGEDAHAARAWRILADTAYAMPSGEWSEPHDSLFGARPSLGVRTAASWSPENARYDIDRFQTALDELLQVAPALRKTSAWRYDVVDVARQALANRSRVLLPDIAKAYHDGDRPRFNVLTATWLDDMTLLDRLLGSSPEFLLGEWEANARAVAAHPREARQLVYDQRSLITHWGEREGADKGGLHDYANRELSGLVGSLYRQRWQRYFASLDRALALKQEPEAIDWFAMERAWSSSSVRYRVVAHGDSWLLASEVARRLERPSGN